MNESVNTIERLIDELCPEEVELKTLGEIGTLIRGSGLQKKDFVKDGVGCIHYGQIYTYYGSFTKSTKTFVPKELAANLKKVNKGDLVIACTSENVNDVCKAVAWLGEEEIVTGGHSTIFKHHENPKYLSYYFQTQAFADQKKKYAKGTKVIEVSAKELSKIKIPLPSIAVQGAIVKILDTFIELEAELKVELEARRRQYVYYRDNLLTFGAMVPKKKFSEVGSFTRGKRFVKSDMVQEGRPCIHYGEMYTHYKIWARESKSFLEQNFAARLRVAHPGDVIIVSAGETIEDIGNGVAWLGDSDVVIHDACFAFKSDLNPKYVSYFLQTSDFRSQIKRFVSSGKISSISIDGLGRAVIPIPPLEEQERIVSILDKFYALVNDASIGLPAEIKARRQQYEYYLGKLFTFKEYAKQ